MCMRVCKRVAKLMLITFGKIDADIVWVRENRNCVRSTHTNELKQSPSHCLRACINVCIEKAACVCMRPTELTYVSFSTVVSRPELCFFDSSNAKYPKRNKNVCFFRCSLITYVFESEHKVQGSKTWRENGIFGLWNNKLLGDGFCQDLFLWLLRHQLFYFSWIFNSNTMENFRNQMYVPWNASNAWKKMKFNVEFQKKIAWMIIQSQIFQTKHKYMVHLFRNEFERQNHFLTLFQVQLQKNLKISFRCGRIRPLQRL